MNETTREWLAKAEADYGTAQRELRVTQSPNFDGVCFHAQQCIEKLLKAVSIDRLVIPARTHDLVQLSNTLSSGWPEWSWPTEELRFLTQASVAFRYPGEAAGHDDAVRAVDIATRLRTALRDALGEQP